MNAVVIKDIEKHYGTVQALRGVSMEVDRGELFGLIGADGSGKTTLFRILTTLILPDKGQATVDGFDVVKDFKQIRKKVGYMPGKFSLYQDLTVEENLSFFATLFGTTIKQNYDLIKDIYQQIEPFKDRRAGKLSGGMKQKLALSCALIHKPSVLFLDEPTTGVDPVSRKEFWGMLKRLREQGITIIVSTPYMDEAKLCDRIALIQDGVFLGIETPCQLANSFTNQLFSVRADRMPALLKTLREKSQVESCFSFGDVHHVAIRSEYLIDERELSLWLENQGYHQVEVCSIAPSIEDCYMQLSKAIRHE